ncbi:LamG-like jellyroll fold domain-containing protein [Streptomyces peucetius]|uniref:Laminin G domain-containing protein n=1 Tax=Streptomyces peucetius TaxID=1950 RepID=A0ABY6I9Z9_STRPE|nr:LamG-like jellyroll fold domain-containing protein [Streptomyces peucetius]UYQ63821.1 hypothetical protein OGH68_21755 [Streptomyces peucetius]
MTTSQPVNDGAWHHAALTAAGNTQTLYLDGAEVGTITGEITQYDQRFVYLGAGYWRSWPAVSGDIGHFTGDIDEAAVYARPLGARTVAQHHASGSAAQQLTQVTLPSDRIHSEVQYDTAHDRVSSYTDANGGTYLLSGHKLTDAEGKPATDDQEAVPADPSATVTVTDPAQRTSATATTRSRATGSSPRPTPQATPPTSDTTPGASSPRRPVLTVRSPDSVTTSAATRSPRPPVGTPTTKRAATPGTSSTSSMRPTRSTRATTS